MLEIFFFQFRSSLGVQFFSFITLFASIWTAVAIIGFFLVVCAWKEQWQRAIAILMGFLIAEGLTSFLKLIFHRLRPQLFPPAIIEHTYSFPSGHATTAAFLFGLIGYLVFQHVKTRKMRVFCLLLVLVMMLLIDLSRLYLGVHYLSDVIAGNIIGFFGLGIVIVMERFRNR